jgi:hypothetical protein
MQRRRVVPTVVSGAERRVTPHAGNGRDATPRIVTLADREHAREGDKREGGDPPEDAPRVATRPRHHSCPLSA